MSTTRVGAAADLDGPSSTSRATPGRLVTRHPVGTLVTRRPREKALSRPLVGERGGASQGLLSAVAPASARDQCVGVPPWRRRPVTDTGSIRISHGLEPREGLEEHSLDPFEVRRATLHHDTPMGAVCAVFAIYLEGDRVVARRGQFRAGAGAEDDAAVIYDVRDREDVRLALVDHRQPRDLLLGE